MPPRYARIAPIQPTEDMDELVRVLNDRITEINIVYTELETAEAVTRGSGGQTTTYDSDLNANGFRITNVKSSREPRDVVTRREMTELGLFPDATGRMNITRPVNFNENVFMSAPSSGSSGGFATINDVIDLINAALDENVATSVDGDIVIIEDATGADGITDGTLAMARDGRTGKARMLKVIGDNLQVGAPDLASLLTVLIQEVRELKIELTSRG